MASHLAKACSRETSLIVSAYSTETPLKIHQFPTLTTYLAKACSRISSWPHFASFFALCTSTERAWKDHGGDCECKVNDDCLFWLFLYRMLHNGESMLRSWWLLGVIIHNHTTSMTLLMMKWCLYNLEDVIQLVKLCVHLLHRFPRHWQFLWRFIIIDDHCIEHW